MQSVFLNNNIVLDLLAKREPYYLPAAKLASLGDRKLVNLHVSALTLANTFYILRRHERGEVVLEKLKKIRVISAISPINDDVASKALNSDFVDFEDALQYFSARYVGAEVIITRNPKDFKSAEIPVMDAEHFLKSYLNK